MLGWWGERDQGPGAYQRDQPINSRTGHVRCRPQTSLTVLSGLLQEAVPLIVCSNYGDQNMPPAARGRQGGPGGWASAAPRRATCPLKELARPCRRRGNDVPRSVDGAQLSAHLTPKRSVCVRYAHKLFYVRAGLQALSAGDAQRVPVNQSAACHLHASPKKNTVADRRRTQKLCTCNAQASHIQQFNRIGLFYVDQHHWVRLERVSCKSGPLWAPATARSTLRAVVQQLVLAQPRTVLSRAASTLHHALLYSLLVCTAVSYRTWVVVRP